MFLQGYLKYMNLIETGIDLTPYKMTAIGGVVNCGKSFIMGLFIDELTSIGKNVYYVNIDGTQLRFDVSDPNVRCFSYFIPEDIIQFYEKLNSTGEEIYICLDSIGSINFNYNNVNSAFSRAKQIKQFLMKLRTFENIKTIFNFNYYKTLRHANKTYIGGHTFCCDKVIDVVKINVVTGKYKHDIYLNEEFLCSLYDLVIRPKIRIRERKISKLID